MLNRKHPEGMGSCYYIADPRNVARLLRYGYQWPGNEPTNHCANKGTPVDHSITKFPIGSSPYYALRHCLHRRWTDDCLRDNFGVAAIRLQLAAQRRSQIDPLLTLRGAGCGH